MARAVMLVRMSRLLSAVPSDLRLRHGPVERAPQDADPGLRRLTVGDESFGAAVEACSVWNAELFSDMRLIQTGRWCASVVSPCRHAGEPDAVSRRLATMGCFSSRTWRGCTAAGCRALGSARTTTCRCVRAPPCQTPMAAVASTGCDAAVSQDSSGGPRILADRDDLCTTSPEPWRNAPAALANSAPRAGCPL
jgi:hypothetical protein